MRYSLISRDTIADCIEIMHEGYFADAIITLGGCDKTVPAALMPIARLNLVGLTLFGGPALPGSCDDITLTDRGLDPGQVNPSFKKCKHFPYIGIALHTRSWRPSEPTPPVSST